MHLKREPCSEYSKPWSPKLRLPSPYLKEIVHVCGTQHSMHYRKSLPNLWWFPPLCCLAYSLTCVWLLFLKKVLSNLIKSSGQGRESEKSDWLPEGSSLQTLQWLNIKSPSRCVVGILDSFQSDEGNSHSHGGIFTALLLDIKCLLDAKDSHEHWTPWWCCDFPHTRTNLRIWSWM